ncbi:MAG: thiamine pyrophosphate-binding protein, partial [Chloroflexota bacterium]
MARTTAGQAIVEVLRRAGVTRVFGVPGESYLGVLDALYDAPVQYVATRHEGGAAFMASGYAKISGEIGVCAGTRAVGASNLAIGIHTARQDSTPLIALAGQVNRPFRGHEAFQELDLVAVFSQYCKWAVELDDPARAVEVLERAVLVARSGRPGPVFVALPEDVLDELTEGPSRAVALPAPLYPDPAALDAVLRDLLAARRPAILAGGGVLASPGAYEALVRFAEAAEVPVFTAWRRHDAFPNDHRLYLGSASLGQPGVVWERLAASDVVLGIGTRFQQLGTRDYTVPGPAQQVLLVDVEPTAATGIAIARRVTADADAALATLLVRLPQPPP